MPSMTRGPGRLKYDEPSSAKTAPRRTAVRSRVATAGRASRPLVDGLGQMEAARHQEEHLGIDLGDRIPGRLARLRRHRRRGGPSHRRVGSARVPSGRRRTAGRAIPARRPAPANGRRRAASATRCSMAPSRSRSASTRSIAASSTSAIAPTVVIGVQDPFDRGGLERDDGDVGVDPAGDLVHLAIADRADAAQLLGEDQVGLGRRERLLVERVERRPAMHRRRDAGMDVARCRRRARSWTLRVTTGLPTTDGGQSHSWVTADELVPEPDGADDLRGGREQRDDAHDRRISAA